MSKRGVPFTSRRSVIGALLMTTLLSAAYAQSGTPGKVEKAKPQTAPLPPDKPKPSPVRGLASLTRQTPLSEAINILRNSTTPPLNIIVLWRPLHNAGVYENTPIGIDGITGLRTGQYLDLLTLSLSAGASARIGYTVHKGAITLSTTDTLPAPKSVARVYDISDLVAPPARYAPVTMGFGLGYGGPMPGAIGYAGSPVSSLSNLVITSGGTSQGAGNYRGR